MSYDRDPISIDEMEVTIRYSKIRNLHINFTERGFIVAGYSELAKEFFVTKHPSTLESACDELLLQLAAWERKHEDD